jgi:hypothetical protein
MRLPEQRLWDSMRRNAPLMAWMQRIENSAVDGMPDVVVMNMGVVTWVELKAAKLPKRTTTRLLGNEGLNQDQINWHIKCQLHGGRSFVLIRDDERQLYLINGSFAAFINDAPAIQLAAVSCASDWVSIFEKIAG